MVWRYWDIPLGNTDAPQLCLQNQSGGRVVALQGDRFAQPEVWMLWTSVSHFAGVCV